MASFLDSIFGSSGGIENVDLLDPTQRQAFDKFGGLVSGQIGQPGPVFQGQRVAGQDPLETQGLQQFGDILGQQRQFDPSQSLGFLQQAQGPLQTALADFDPSATRQQFQEQFVAPAREAFGDIQGDILEGAARRNATSSGFLNTALAKAGGRVSTQLGSQLANLLFQTEQAQRNRQLQAVGQAGNLALLPGQIAQQGAGLASQRAGIAGQAIQAGRGQRAFGQQQITAEQQKFLESQAINNPALRELLPLLVGTQSQQPIFQQGDTGLLGSLGPAIGQFLGTEAGASAVAGIPGKIAGLFGGGKGELVSSGTATGGGFGQANPGGGTTGLGGDALERLLADFGLN